MQVAIGRVIDSRPAHGSRGCLVAAISGIDAAGKTTLARQVAHDLESRGLRAALIHLDSWHAPPQDRFGPSRSPEHFYRNAFRLPELFDRLVEPLRRKGSLKLTVDLIRLPGNVPYSHTYDFRNVEVILLEGIFLLKRELRPRYDLSFWLDCPFDVALRRALGRNQEWMSAAEIVRDYTDLYFPAQRLHLERDRPHDAADLVLSADLDGSS